MTALTQVVLQDNEKSSQYVHLDVKIYWILSETLKFHNPVHARAKWAHTVQKLLEMDFEICRHENGVGGTGWTWLDPWSFIFEFTRGISQKFEFFCLLSTKIVEN